MEISLLLLLNKYLSMCPPGKVGMPDMSDFIQMFSVSLLMVSRSWHASVGLEAG